MTHEPREPQDRARVRREALEEIRQLAVRLQTARKPREIDRITAALEAAGKRL